jgi:ribosomal protein L28
LVPINCSFDFSGVQVNCSSISHSSIGWSRQQQGKISGFVIHTFVLITGCATQWSFLYGDEGSCDTCQARVVTFSHKRIEKVQQVNFQWKRFQSDALGRRIGLCLSTKVYQDCQQDGIH